MSRYSKYLLGIPTPNSLYSKYDCHGRNISELNGKLICGFNLVCPF